MSRYLRILIALFLLAALYYQLGGFEADEMAKIELDETGSRLDSPLPLADGEPPLDRTEAADEAVVVASSEPEIETTELEIGRNESFYVALTKQGLSHETVMEIVNACKPHTNLRRVKRGDVFQLERRSDGEFVGLRFELDAAHFLQVSADGENINASLESYPVDRIVRGVHGVIETNLFDALQEAGADPLLADEIASILGWKIDFFRDLRVGDEFTVLYEEYVYNGRPAREGHVLACQFTNQGKLHDAYVFESPLGLPSYYDSEGGSLERQFLRAPLKYSRISSGFTHRRLHPVTKTVRPHYGVDYVAPTGTPVFATADGVVIKRTRNRASGNFVGLRHGNGFESYYLHLSRFDSDAQVGNRVKQGDVIGYVGQSGWATAPHLDYRIKKNGRWSNPRTLDLPPAEPVAAERLEEFSANRDRMLTLLDEIMGVETFVLDSSRPELQELGSYYSED